MSCLSVYCSSLVSGAGLCSEPTKQHSQIVICIRYQEYPTVGLFPDMAHCSARFIDNICRNEVWRVWLEERFVLLFSTMMSTETYLTVVFGGNPCEQYLQGQTCPLRYTVHPAFLLPTKALSSFDGVLKDGFGEACDMPELSKFPSLDSCQTKFLWTHNEVALAGNLTINLDLALRFG